jgi:hypothetical protein
MGDMETIALPALVVFTALRLAWDAMKWAGSRGVKKADETLEKLEAVEKAVDQLVHLAKTLDKMDGKLDAFGSHLGEHDRQIIELQIHMRHVQAERHTLLQHLSDLSGFLSTHGFKERKRPEVEP